MVATLSLQDPENFEMCLDRINWMPIGGGITNYNYKLNIGRDKYFVQLVDPNKIERLPGGRFVPVSKVIAENNKLAFWVPECLLDSNDIRLFSWIDAVNSKHDNFNSEIFVEKLCHFFSVLHKDISTLPFLDITRHLETYYHLAVKYNPKRKSNFQESYKQALKFCRSFNASNTCHNDISPGNLLIGDEIYLVDWEYACIGDPLFDLAGVSINFQLNEKQESYLLETYSGQLDTYFHIEKFHEMKLLYNQITEFWESRNE